MGYHVVVYVGVNWDDVQVNKEEDKEWMALEEKVSQDRYYRDDGENGVLCYLEDRDDTFRGYHTTSISDGSEHILLITNTYLYDNGGPYSFQFSPEEISAFLKATGAEKIEVFLDWV